MFNIQTALYLIPIGIGVAAVAGYFVGTFRKGANQASAQSNTILRGLIDDQKKEIDALKETVEHQASQIKDLQERVKTGEELKSLVVIALKDYFESHPTKAVNLVNKIK